MQSLVYIFIACAGLCVGSFCNVLMLRIPRGEEFVKTPSHCMHCGKRLRWYELVPLVSYLAQGGRCRGCGARLSRQYPIVEAANAAAWVLSWALAPDAVTAALYSAMSSLLLVLAVIDARIFELPNGLNLALAVLGAVRVATDAGHWLGYLLGAVCVSLPFFLLWFATKGAGIGLGDAKLMAACGLILGWQKILLATLLGCVLGSVIHLARMRGGAPRRLAFGPYLASGVWLAAMFGGGIINWYLGLLGL